MSSMNVQNRFLRCSKRTRKLIEKYSTRWYNINTRPSNRPIGSVKKDIKRISNLPDPVLLPDFVHIKEEPLEPTLTPEPEIIADDLADSDALMDVTNHDETHENTFSVETCDLNADAINENMTEMWNLVSQLFYSYLLERISNDQNVSTTKSRKRRKTFYSGASKKLKQRDDIPDQYYLQTCKENYEIGSTCDEKVAILVHLGVKRPVFPQIYQNIITHCGINKDNVITEAWAEFSLSTLLTDNKPRIKPVVFPVVEPRLLLDIQDFNGANDIKFQNIEVLKEKQVIPPIESASIIKSEPEGFNMDLIQTAHQGSPKTKKLPCIVSNVRSLCLETSSRMQRQRKTVDRDYESICLRKNYNNYNMDQRKSLYSAPAINWNKLAKEKGFKPCWVVLKRVKWKTGQKKFNTTEYQIEADLKWFDKVIRNDLAVIHPPEVEAPEETPHREQIAHKVLVPDEGNLSTENHFFGHEQCTRTYGIMIDYTLRNKSTVYLYKMRKSLKFQCKYNKVFKNSHYLRVQHDETREEELADIEEISDKHEAYEMPKEFISMNPLKVLKIPVKLNKFGAPLLRDPAAVSQHTDKIRRVDNEILKCTTHMKWIILELNTGVENIKYKSTYEFAANLLFELMYRADLSKTLVCTVLCKAKTPTMANFGIYGVPGLTNGVIIGPINTKDRSPTIAATIKNEDGTLSEYEFNIVGPRRSTVPIDDAVKARWWRPGINDAGISIVMNSFLNFHFTYHRDRITIREPVLKLSSLVLIHKADTYLTTMSKGTEKNITLIHDKVHKSMRNEKLKSTLKIAVVDDDDDDDDDDDKLAEIGPAFEEEADRTSFSYRNKRRMEKRQFIRNNCFNKNVLKQMEHPSRHFIDEMAEVRRVAEKQRRMEFFKNKINLCSVLRQAPHMLSLNGCILKAISEIKKLELENGELEVKKLQLVQSRNRLGCILVNKLKNMNPNSRVSKYNKFKISNMLHSTVSTDVKDLEENPCEEFDKIYRTAAVKDNSVSVNYQRACPKSKKQIQKSDGFESRCSSKKLKDAGMSLANLLSEESNLAHQHQNENPLIKSRKIAALLDHDYINHVSTSKRNVAENRNWGGEENKIHVVLLEFGKPVYEFVAKQVTGGTDADSTILVRNLVQNILDKIRNNTEHRKYLIEVKNNYRYLVILEAMLNVERKLSRICQWNDRNPKHKGTSFTSLVSLNRRYMCRIICHEKLQSDVIDEKNMQSVNGVNDEVANGIQESCYIENVLSFDTVDIKTLSSDDSLNKTRNKHVPGILKRDLKRFVPKITQKADFKILFDNNVMPKLCKPRLKNIVSVSPKILQPLQKPKTVFDKNSISKLLNYLNVDNVSNFSKPIISNILNDPTFPKIVVPENRDAVVIVKHSPKKEVIETLGNRDSEDSLLDLPSRTSSTESAQSAVFKDAASDSGNESDLSVVGLQVKSFASINTLHNNLISNVDKLLK